MTAPAPEPQPPAPPRFVRWGACERCGAAGPASEADDRFCRQCLPPPQVARDRQRRVVRRVDQAKRAAARSTVPLPDAAVAPDAEHVWLSLPNWGCAHLFTDAETEARCGRVAVLRPVRADLDVSAPETARSCKACWRSYRRGRRGP